MRHFITVKNPEFGATPLCYAVEHPGFLKILEASDGSLSASMGIRLSEPDIIPIARRADVTVTTRDPDGWPDGVTLELPTPAENEAYLVITRAIQAAGAHLSALGLADYLEEEAYRVSEDSHDHPSNGVDEPWKDSYADDEIPF